MKDYINTYCVLRYYFLTLIFSFHIVQNNVSEGLYVYFITLHIDYAPVCMCVFKRETTCICVC